MESRRGLKKKKFVEQLLYISAGFFFHRRQHLQNFIFNQILHYDKYLFIYFIIVLVWYLFISFPLIPIKFILIYLFTDIFFFERIRKQLRPRTWSQALGQASVSSHRYINSVLHQRIEHFDSNSDNNQ